VLPRRGLERFLRHVFALPLAPEFHTPTTMNGRTLPAAIRVDAVSSTFHSWWFHISVAS
jgi:hypothetical protein